MKRILIALALATAALISSSIDADNTHPAYAATFAVTNLNDSGPGSLRDAVNLTNTTPGPDAITFSVNGTINLLSSLDFTDPAGITVDATGKTIMVDGSALPNYAFGLMTQSANLIGFTINSPRAALLVNLDECTRPVTSLSLKKMTIQAGTGAVHICSSSVSNVSISESTLTGAGSFGILVSPSPELGGSVTLSNFSVAQSKISGSGSGIDIRAVGAGNVLSVNGVTITNSTLTASTGTAIRVAGDSAHMTVNNVTVSGNTVFGKNYGIIILADASGTNIQGITISGNPSITGIDTDAISIGGANAANRDIFVNQNGRLESTTGTTVAIRGKSNENIQVNGNSTIHMGLGSVPVVVVACKTSQCTNSRISVSNNLLIEGTGGGVKIGGDADIMPVSDIDVQVNNNTSIIAGGIGVSIGGDITVNKNLAVNNNGSIQSGGIAPAVSVIGADNSNVSVNNNSSIAGGTGISIDGSSATSNNLININGNGALVGQSNSSVYIGGSQANNSNISVSNNREIRGHAPSPASPGAVFLRGIKHSDVSVTNNTTIMGTGYAGGVTIGGASTTNNSNITVSNNGAITSQAVSGVEIMAKNNSNVSVNNNTSIIGSGVNEGVFIGGGQTTNDTISVSNNKSIGGPSGIKIRGLNHSNMTIRGNESVKATAAGSSISIGGTSGNASNAITSVLINNNSVTGGARGIHISGSVPGTKNEISNNAVFQNSTGVELSVSNFTVSGNTIRDNSGAGVAVLSGTGNRITQNSIYSNGGLGIDLGGNGITPNDSGDGDTGPNNLQNFPVLTAAASFGGNTIVQGNLNSTPNTAFRLEFFSNPAGSGQGKTFIGQATVTTNAGGNADFLLNFSVSVPAGNTTTATATDPGNNTSEFSQYLVPPPSTADCKVTYGGSINANNGDKATFGGNAQVPLKGEQQFTDHGPATPMNVHSINVLAVFCSADRKQASIFGQATINSTGSYVYRIDLKDMGEPGTNDTYQILLSNGYDSGEHLLEGGNVQIR